MNKTHLDKWFWPVVWRNKLLYAHILAAAFFINVFALLLPIFIMNVYDRVIPNYATETLWVLASGLIIIIIFDFILKSLRSFFIDNNARTIDLNLLSKIYEKLLGAQLSHLPTPTGNLANDINSFQAFRDFITSATVTILIDLPFVVLFLLTIALIGGMIFLIPLLAMIIVFCLVYFLQPYFYQLTLECTKLTAKKQNLVFETAIGSETIRVMNQKNWFLKLWQQTIDQFGIKSIKLNAVSSSILSIAYALQQLTIVLLIVFGVYAIHSGHLTLGGLIASVILTTRALSPMVQLTDLITRFNRARNAIEISDRLMELPVEFKKSADLLTKTLQGNVEFNKVNFSYPHQQQKMLNDISFKIKAGEHLGVLGRIGCGKTTLLRLILQLYSQDSGNILFDDLEAKQFDIEAIRENIGYVPQDIILFNGSLKYNITLGKENYQDEAILNICKMVGLEQLISLHPQGLAMQIGERGNLLSGGQKQAIAIARALIKNPNIIIMDEPTNSMDDASELRLIGELKKYLQNKTLILVTHKLTMLSLVERIMFLDNGKKTIDSSKQEFMEKLTKVQTG